MMLLIDGYNIIGAWAEFRDSLNLQESRERLIEILCDYAGYTGDTVILVFDAYAGDNPRRTIEQIAGIEVVYTKQGETADHYIERMTDTLCRNLSRQIELRVATSDAIEQTIVLGRGAARISSLELRALVMGVRQAGRESHQKSKKVALEQKLPEHVINKLLHLRNTL